LIKVIDLHCDTIGEVQARKNFLEGNTDGLVDIPRMQSGNAGTVVFVSFISSVMSAENAYFKAKEMLELTKQTCDSFPENLLFVDSFSSIENVWNSDKIGILSAVENGHTINNQISNLEQFRKIGARYMTLTHSQNLDWAASSGEKSCKFEGLTDFGVKVVHAMNELGMIVDVSHVHESTFWDVAQHSKKPFIASHSNVHNICPIARNLTDNQIKVIADKGGMIGINFFPGFLDIDYSKGLEQHCSDLFEAFDNIEQKHLNKPVEKNKSLHKFYYDLQQRMTNYRVGIEKIIQHIQYIVNLVGDDFVGFGSDFDGIPSLPNDISGFDAYTKIINQLQNTFLNISTVEKIAYKNFLRVLKENE
jgi:membrane dipeptidase